MYDCRDPNIKTSAPVFNRKKRSLLTCFSIEFNRFFFSIFHNRFNLSKILCIARNNRYNRSFLFFAEGIMKFFRVFYMFFLFFPLLISAKEKSKALDFVSFCLIKAITSLQKAINARIAKKDI